MFTNEKRNEKTCRKDLKKNNESNYARHAPTIRLFVEIGKQGQVTLMYMYMLGIEYTCIPSPLPSSPRFRLGLLSQGSGLILLIHTEKPCRHTVYITYIIYRNKLINILKYKT